MIGKVMTGASFYHCISYCLEDKRVLSAERKQELSALDGLQHSGRAEVLEYNRCFGNKRELTRQFSDVQKLSKRVEKPVLHLALRPAPGEQLTDVQWRVIARECAQEFGVSDNQYLVILHRDTDQPHIHIVANRVGLDGRAARDGNSYRRMAELCRRIEKKYQLKEVPSPNAFLPVEKRGLPRTDRRREKLASDIRGVLQQAAGFPDFERHMGALGYQVEKGRGIAFIDDKKVRTKGSQVGFPLAVIERILAEARDISLKEQVVFQGRDSAGAGTAIAKESNLPQGIPEAAAQGNNLINILLSTENESGQVPFELTERQTRKKRRTGRRI